MGPGFGMGGVGVAGGKGGSLGRICGGRGGRYGFRSLPGWDAAVVPITENEIASKACEQSRRKSVEIRMKTFQEVARRVGPHPHLELRRAIAMEFAYCPTSREE